MSSDNSSSTNRQSVDWYAGLAADQRPLTPLPTMAEEDEKEEHLYSQQSFAAPIPQIQVDEPATDTQNDTLADVDRSIGIVMPFNGLIIL